MANITTYGPLALLRADPSQHVLRFAKGKLRASGRGLVFWFAPATASLAEVPLDDREMTFFTKGRSADFQDVSVQGMIGWHVAAPEQAADRIDFTIDPRTGKWNARPVESIETRISGIAGQAALEYLATAPVRALLDAGVDPLRDVIGAALADNPGLAQIGVEVVSVRLANLAPTSELERALQTPTFEALQQKADEATFARRALAVEKERAIAENELATKVELAKRQKVLIAEEADNARAEARGEAEAAMIAAEGDAARIREVEMAKAEAEQAHMAVYRDLPPQVLLGLAAREFAAKVEGIEQLNIAPDMLAEMARVFAGARAAPAPIAPPVEG
ncbi:SPFH domain-containing protein [Aurantiacibacter aquimixticola]|uniref:Band 7 protein n=1 Tax=Aurantiacibacter aquimixticola TaxID=1958945 RepID=A0A419RT47_9SPHN|nr:SPFH domain-containing protein [Aurantiacibacter aquimixticola]RJY08971.1 band 7 protein [Aurantiacibacter aquimixticola]